jgi:hypothetical protein
MPWPCCCCCCCCFCCFCCFCCCSSPSPHPQHSPLLSSPQCTHAAPNPLSCLALPCPACLPSSLLLSSCPVLSLQPIRPSPPLQCSALARPILLPESHPISCSARRRQACVPPSQRHLPALPVSSEMPVCWPSHGGVADIALKSPCLPSAPTCGSISATWEGGIKLSGVVRAYSRIPGTHLGDCPLNCSPLALSSLPGLVRLSSSSKLPAPSFEALTLDT